VNTKVARLDEDGTLIVRSRPFELQREPGALVRVLRELAEELGAPARRGLAGALRAKAGGLTCAVTMTAELSQMFRTKREGVHFVLDAVTAAFPEATIQVFATDGRFLALAAAREQPMAVAAANWAATARIVAQRHPDAMLIDVGTTTTDIIPVVNGEVVAEGQTDPERLASGELVYSGALRTPLEAIIHRVRHRGCEIGVSAEGFALVGDVHLWLGNLGSEDYTVPTPDGRPATREFAGERIARVICADRELVNESDVTHIAKFIAAAQVTAIAAAIRRVRSRHPSLKTAIVTGLGHFIATAAARSESLEVVSLSDDIGDAGARYAPAAAVALLWAEERRPHLARTNVISAARSASDAAATVLVIKIGGGLLEHVDHFARVVAAVADVSRTIPVVVVPGGGPFADAVRRVDERLTLGDEEAHWMAVLGMDQYAHLLAARMEAGVVISTRAELEAAHHSRRVPVLAPSVWLKAADPLPHSWDVTSDSIAAWVAAELGAAHLLLIKPPGARGPDLVDAHFAQARSARCVCDCLGADEAIEMLSRAARRGEAHALEPQ
jgi:probable H4MPT-linked C1 transfer pathway protein